MDNRMLRARQSRANRPINTGSIYLCLISGTGKGESAMRLSRNGLGSPYPAPAEWLSYKLILMKALVISKFSEPEVLRVEEVATPQVRPGEVLVKVAAAGVNFADVITAKGGYPGVPEPPLTAGREFAGIEQQTGKREMGYVQW